MENNQTIYIYCVIKAWLERWMILGEEEMERWKLRRGIERREGMSVFFFFPGDKLEGRGEEMGVIITGGDYGWFSK